MIRYLDTTHSCKICGKHKGRGTDHSACSRELQKRSRPSTAQRKQNEDKLVNYYDQFLKYKI